MNDFKILTEELKKFSSERDWNQFHNAKDLALALNVEANELLEYFFEKKLVSQWAMLLS